MRDPAGIRVPDHRIYIVHGSIPEYGADRGLTVSR